MQPNKYLQLQSVCFVFRVIFQAAFVFLLAGYAVSWIAVMTGYTAFSFSLQYFALSFFVTVCTLAIIFFLIKLFLSYEKNIFFTAGNATLIKRAGVLLLAQQIVTPIWRAILSGQWPSISFYRIEMIVLALVIILNGWLTVEAYKIRQDQDLTI